MKRGRQRAVSLSKQTQASIRSGFKDVANRVINIATRAEATGSDYTPRHFVLLVAEMHIWLGRLVGARQGVRVSAGRMRSLRVIRPSGISPFHGESHWPVGLIIDDESTDLAGQIRLTGADIFRPGRRSQYKDSDHDCGSHQEADSAPNQSGFSRRGGRCGSLERFSTRLT